MYSDSCVLIYHRQCTSRCYLLESVHILLKHFDPRLENSPAAVAFNFVQLVLILHDALVDVVVHRLLIQFGQIRLPPSWSCWHISCTRKFFPLHLLQICIGSSSQRACDSCGTTAYPFLPLSACRALSASSVASTSTTLRPQIQSSVWITLFRM